MLVRENVDLDREQLVLGERSGFTRLKTGKKPRIRAKTQRERADWEGQTDSAACL